MQTRRPRWLLRHVRRLATRWRAFRMPPEAGFDDPAFPSLLADTAPEAQARAIATACEMLGVVRAGDVHRGIMRRSLGVQARAPDGSPSWLKISRLDDPLRKQALPRERTAQALRGVPMPALLREAEWQADGAAWHAFQFSLAPSPAVRPTPWIDGPPPEIGDGWLADLKRAIGRLSAEPLSQWLVHPGSLARVIGRRYGRTAPFEIDEWRTAHGDLNWSNVTAPALCLLDWERWGAAPRGFDIATLLSVTVMQPELYRRIERTFAADLDTPSGIAARLYLLAWRLNQIEAGFRDPREHGPLEREARRLLRG